MNDLERERYPVAPKPLAKANTGKVDTIPRRDVTTPCPVSFAQQRLWFLDRLIQGSTLYSIPLAHRLVGELDVGALQRSLGEIMRRHEALRTVFCEQDGGPMQVIVPEARFELPVIEATENEVEDLVREEARRPFDLGQDMLVRAQLLRLSAQQHVLLLTMHHIVSDGWSMGVLFRELSVLYEAFTEAAPSPLTDLPIQYADYAVWQRGWLRGERLERQLGYWKKQLAQVTALELPTDRPRSVMLAHRGRRADSKLSHELTDALKALSLQERVTSFMILLSAFQVLLYRYSGQDDIVVGSPIAGRTRMETQTLIGFFVNTLALRTDLSGEPTFRDLLSRVKEVALGAYEHADVPFEKLVDELKIERDLSRNPLFQVMFAFNNTPRYELRLRDLRVDRLVVNRESAFFDLSVFVTERDEGFEMRVNYDTDLFDQHTIERLEKHYEELLRSILRNPNQQISKLPFLTEQERSQLLVEWNDTSVDYPKEHCIHQLFEAQVDRNPDAVALAFEDIQLTYAQLNKRANQLAHYLCSLGIGRDVPVGICMERSVEMLVGLLGILKAGGAYVPLDPSHPKDRLALMLEEAETPLLLTQQSVLENLSQSGARAVCLDTHWNFIAQQSTDNVVSEVKPDDLAYVIYTSGSTGKPKGVSMRHSSLCNLIAWQRCNPFACNSLRTLQFAPISFDVSFQEIFSTWCSGGVLVLATEETRRKPGALLRLVEIRGIERLFVPFVTLQLLAKAAAELQSLPTTLRVIITAGEQLRITPTIVAFFERLDHCVLVNHYGPSESHAATSFTLDGSPNRWPTVPPIGRPIANAQIYILDRYLQPVPIGVPGELHIGGAGLARGYLCRPDLTTEKFIPNVFSDDPGERLYKTGDLARYQPDGNIEFLGRTDNQVKIRGFRVELGEIETILSSHPAVRQAVVLVHEDAATGKYLVAHVAPERQSLSSSELRDLLRAKLPDYMVPTVFMLLKSLPLTPHGKIDRRALLRQEVRPPTIPESGFVAPRTPTEEILANIWSEILGIERASIHDNFFHSGGHSLLAIQLLSRVEREFGCTLAPDVLFQHPTVSGLAGAVQEVQKATDRSPLEAEETEHQRIYQRQYRLISGWKGQRASSDSMVLLLNPDAQGPPLFWGAQDSEELTALVDQVEGRIRLYLMRSSRFVCEIGQPGMQVLAEKYAREIEMLEPEGELFIGGFCLGAAIALEVSERLCSSGREVRGQLLVDGFQHVVRRQRSCVVPTTLVFPRDGVNPYRIYKNPEVGFRRYLPNLLDVWLTDGGHAALLRREHVAKFCELVNQVVKNPNLSHRNIGLTEGSRHAPLCCEHVVNFGEQTQQVVDKPTNLQSQLKRDGSGLRILSDIKDLKFITGDGSMDINLKIQNDSSSSWNNDTSPSVFVYSRWIDGDHTVLRWGDTCVALPHIEKDGSADLTLTVEPPEYDGLRYLELDIVEEGISQLSRLLGRPVLRFPIEIEDLQNENRYETGFSAQAEIWFDRAALEYSRGDYANAADSYTRAIRATDHPDFHHLVSWVRSLYQAKRFGSVINAVDTYPTLMEEDESRLAYGGSYLRQGQSVRAMEILSPVSSDRWEVSRLKLLAEGLVNVGQYNDATITLVYAAALIPGQEWPWLRAGKIYDTLNQPAKALECYEKARNSHVTPQVCIAIARSCIRLSQFPKALAALDLANVLDPDYATNHEVFYECLMAMGEADAARQVVARVEEYCLSARVFHRIGKYLAKRSCHTEGEALLNKAREISYSSTPARQTSGLFR